MAIKNVKMLGLAEAMEKMIRDERRDELEISKGYRRLQTLRINVGMVTAILPIYAHWLVY